MWAAMSIRTRVIYAWPRTAPARSGHRGPTGAGRGTETGRSVEEVAQGFHDSPRQRHHHRDEEHPEDQQVQFAEPQRERLPHRKEEDRPDQWTPDRAHAPKVGDQ